MVLEEAGAAGTAALAALSLSLEPLWDDARESGLVGESIESVLDRLTRELGGGGLAELERAASDLIARAAPPSVLRQGRIRKLDADRMRRWARLHQAPLLERRVLELVGAHLKGADQIVDRAAREGWSRRRFREALDDLARRYGSESGTTLRGDHLDTWWRTFVVQESYQSGLFQMIRREPTVRLYPYLRHFNFQDGRQRPSHDLHPYLVATRSPKAERIRKPWGWNCRCGSPAVNWMQVRELGVNVGLEEPWGPMRTVSGVGVGGPL